MRCCAEEGTHAVREAWVCVCVWLQQRLRHDQSAAPKGGGARCIASMRLQWGAQGLGLLLHAMCSLTLSACPAAKSVSLRKPP